MRDEDKPCWNCKNLDELGGCTLNDGINPVWLDDDEVNNFTCYNKPNTTFMFRDINPNGVMEVYLDNVEDPAFLVSLTGEYRIMYGEFDDLIPRMNEYSILEPVAVLPLPRNQEEVDKLFQSTGLTAKFIRDWKKMQNIK